MMYRDLDSSVFASNENVILDLVSTNLDVPIWDIKLKQYGRRILEKKAELEVINFFYFDFHDKNFSTYRFLKKLKHFQIKIFLCL